MRNRLFWIIAVIAVVAPSSLNLVGQDPDEGGIEIYSATMVGLRGLPGGPITIRIERFTTDEEMEQLAAVVDDGGQEALRRELEGVRIGKIYSPSYIGTYLALARATPTENGRRILLITPRPLTFDELQTSSPTRKSPFWRIALNVDAQGKGDGVMEPATKVRFTAAAELEDFTTGPLKVILSNLRRID